MMSIIFAIISGISMTLQGVFNTRLSEKIGTWETNVLVQGIALVITLIVSFILKDTNYKAIKDVNKLYLLGGVLGVIIIFTVMKSIGNMGPTCGIAIILIAQLISAALIDAFGLFDTPKVPFNFKQIAGVIVMICGIILFKWK
ncbi:DMT family transporter [Clostridium sp. HCP1S3_B4]|uniref:DMT family transporter n=1 Tax=unclassified Clostridium TaxID=2614128 RepID=UPI0016A78B36|nr:DMT family transporter [Clostridiales bacterium]MDY2729753.1 DMT family transporter [Clostridium sp.]NLK23540.1 DMT family transporter [Clostridiales bacterium]